MTVHQVGGGLQCSFENFRDEAVNQRNRWPSRCLGELQRHTGSAAACPLDWGGGGGYRGKVTGGLVGIAAITRSEWVYSVLLQRESLTYILEAFKEMLTYLSGFNWILIFKHGQNRINSAHFAQMGTK